MQSIKRTTRISIDEMRVVLSEKTDRLKHFLQGEKFFRKSRKKGLTREYISGILIERLKERPKRSRGAKVAN